MHFRNMISFHRLNILYSGGLKLFIRHDVRMIGIVQLDLGQELSGFRGAPVGSGLWVNHRLLGGW
jgi:hypothetical protein